MKEYAGRRVLMLVENQPYPKDVRVKQEAAALANAGYQVSVICPAGAQQPYRDILDGVRVYRYPAPPVAYSFLAYLWEYTYSLVATFLLSLLVCWRGGFDIIHAANPPDTAVFIAAIYKVFGKRFVFDHHDLAPEMYDLRFKGRGHGLIRLLLVWLEQLSCRTADHVITTNLSHKAMEMQRGRVPEGRITIVRNGPALDRIKRAEVDLSLRAKGRVIIGYVGVMAVQDGLDYLLRALRHLVRDFERTDFFCVIIGDGDALPTLQAMVAELDLDQHVWFPGFVSEADLLRYLSTADICVDPDPSNPFNDQCTMIKMMEYMALAKPIVAFDLPEHRLTAQGAALYARPNDELDFARQILALMDDAERRHKLGLLGRQRVEAELAWSHQQDRLLEVYRTLCGNGAVVSSMGGTRSPIP
jgi:glycosyltransferase involved in cell wall biosynthesis